MPGRLVDADHDRFRGRVQVQTHDVADLGLELGGSRVVMWLWSDGQVDRLAELLVSTIHEARLLSPNDPTTPDVGSLLSTLTDELTGRMPEKELARLTREMLSRVTTRFPGVAG